MAIETITEEMEDIDLKCVEEYMDLFLMENTDSEVKDQIKKEEIPQMMYEENRLWNMEEITQRDDQYTISMDDNPRMDSIVDDDEEEAIMLTNLLDTRSSR